MVSIGALWTPIVVSAILVFVASFFLWVVLPHHKSDWRKLPNEEAVRKALTRDIRPGQYVVPYAADSKEMQSEEYRKRCEEGPAGILTLRHPSRPAMGKPLAFSFLYYLAISTAVAYIAGRMLPGGADYLAVFRVAGTTATLAYAGALFPQAIWFGRPWSAMLKEAADGVAYGLLTAGAFGWLWPR
ncbi:MAG: hypothetical protein ACRD21_07855 [Vicinamibacteria bacterium]